MAALLLSGKRWDTGELIAILVRDGCIASVHSANGPSISTGQSSAPSSQSSIVDRVMSTEPGLQVLEAEFIAPGFCDIQVNGAGGHNFTSRELTTQQIRMVAEECWRHGTTEFCPTVITSDNETMTVALRQLAKATEEDARLRRSVVGFHLEGPYICPAPGPRGAHPAEHIRPPQREEFRRFQEAASGRIRIVTLSPHWPGACDFIHWLAEQGIVVAIGHHQASSDQIRDAVRAGARLSTHLGNGCDLMLPRHPNYIWDQLATDELWASLIADGHHLPPAVVKCFLRCKMAQRCVLISDASPLAGLPPGRYQLWNSTVEVQPSGRAVVIDDRGGALLAGACSFLDTGIFRAWHDGGLTLPEALRLAIDQPRALLGLSPPNLSCGELANLVLFDLSPGQLQIRYTIFGDHVVAASHD